MKSFFNEKLLKDGIIVSEINNFLQPYNKSLTITMVSDLYIIGVNRLDDNGKFIMKDCEFKSLVYEFTIENLAQNIQNDLAFIKFNYYSDIIIILNKYITYKSIYNEIESAPTQPTKKKSKI